jgi:hypothetical protein
MARNLAFDEEEAIKKAMEVFWEKAIVELLFVIFRMRYISMLVTFIIPLLISDTFKKPYLLSNVVQE